MNDDLLETLAEYQLATAKAWLTDVKLSDLRSIELSALLSGETRDDHAKRLMSEQIELHGRAGELSRLLRRPQRAGEGVAAAHLDEIADVIASGWYTVPIPLMQKVSCAHPEIAGTEGRLFSSPMTVPGKVHYYSDDERQDYAVPGLLHHDGSVEPQTEQWWRCAWKATVAFPEAPADGVWHYRFAVDSKLSYYRLGGRSGMLAATVSVVEYPGGGQPSPVTRSVGWPINIAVPPSKPVDHVGGVTHVSGHLRADTGQRTSIDVVYAVLVGLATGSAGLGFPGGEFEARVTNPGQILAANRGKVECKFVEDSLAKVIGDHLDPRKPRFP